MMDFQQHAGAATNFDTIPNGQLAWAILTVRGIKVGGSGSKYLDCELTIDAGQPFAGRKVFEKIGDPTFEGNSEKYRQMGQVAVTRILECSGASPANPAGYQLASFEQLSGRRVAIRVGIEEGDGGHDDKNRVSEWLTPNPASKSGFKHFERLQKGEFSPPSSGGGQAATTGFGGFGGAPAGGQQQTGGFGQQSGGAQPASAGFGSKPAAQTTGFGNGSGFQAPPADSSGQSGANAAGTAEFQSAPTGANASHSNGTSGNWLEQANGSSAPRQ